MFHYLAKLYFELCLSVQFKDIKVYGNNIIKWTELKLNLKMPFMCHDEHWTYFPYC